MALLPLHRTIPSSSSTIKLLHNFAFRPSFCCSWDDRLSWTGVRTRWKTFFFSCCSKRRMRNRIDFLLLEFFRKHQTTRDGKKESFDGFSGQRKKSLFSGRRFVFRSSRIDFPAVERVSSKDDDALSHVSCCENDIKANFPDLEPAFPDTHSHTHTFARSRFDDNYATHASCRSVIFSLAALLRIHSPRFNYN